MCTICSQPGVGMTVDVLEQRTYPPTSRGQLGVTNSFEAREQFVPPISHCGVLCPFGCEKRARK